MKPATAEINGRDEEQVLLGWTLPAILDDVCEYHPNPCCLNHRDGEGWRSFSTPEVRTLADEIAAGLACLGIERGERAALLMKSDALFCIVDMGCLIAGVVDVPIYPSSRREIAGFILKETTARVLFVNGTESLGKLQADLAGIQSLTHVVVTDADESDKLSIVPPGPEVLSLDELQRRGRERLEAEPDLPETCRQRIATDDLATIIYTSGTTGHPKGVMLSHENLSSNGLTGYTALGIGRNEPETFLSFLPLAHVFQRSAFYAFLHHGGSIYFCETTDIGESMREIRPTIFITVPRVLERISERIRLAGARLSGPKLWMFRWAQRLAASFHLGRPPRGLLALQHRMADRLIFARWRKATGGRVRLMLCGGAPLEPAIANFFGAAGLVTIQGYGLTETSPVITFNRPHRNRAGTVGEPMAGVEVALADDGEVMARGPNVTAGYFLRPEATAKVLDEDGWFHTGDLGEFDGDGLLRITDRKDNRFKLSTGQYVTPQPLETKLSSEPLVAAASVIGAARKFTAALIFPDQENLLLWAELHGLKPDLRKLVRKKRVRRRFQRMVNEANRGMQPWMTIKRFRLVLAELTVENELLTPTLKTRRGKVHSVFQNEIEKLYDDTNGHDSN